ncbi:T9SS type A sorting domain-containing protein [Ilyomonas limi]|nr:T9SS type A sorting domain-containing protein [Ilyomonas limi]
MKRSYTFLFFPTVKSGTTDTIANVNLLHSNSNNRIYNTATDLRIALLPLRVFILLMLFTVTFIELKAQVTNTTVFPLNEYLTTENGSPYPVLVQSKLDEIDTSMFVNVMDYGAKGDGETWDDEAIERAFNNARYGVIFPANKTFLVHKLTTITIPNRDLTVYAYGATIKMDAFSRYSFLSLEYEQGSYNNTVIWLGGKLWGNKRNQSWPGSPSGNNTWAEDHGRFLGISYAKFALVKDVSVVGVVMDGIGLESCKLGVIADCQAWGGAPFTYAKDQDQGTYFKCTRTGSQAFYCMNLVCNGGSIGVHYSTSTVEDNSLAVITNCQFNNQAQDALHFEDCRKVFMYNSTVQRDITGDYVADIHISNRTQIASIKSCQFTNARVDFNNASDLMIGVVDSCKFISEFKNNDNGSLATCLAGATHCINSSFSGRTDIEQAWADNVKNCDFSNFADLALRGPHVANNSSFKNGPNPMSLAKDGVVVNCTFDNVGNSDYRKPEDDDWKKPFLSVINIYSDDNEYLGRITCGGADNEDKASIDGNKTVASSAFSRPQYSGTLINKDTLKGDKMSFITSGGAALSIKDNITNQRISLYPNPTTDVLHVALNDKLSGKAVLNIYDQQGRLIQTKTVYKNTSVLVETLDVHTLTAGAYVLQILNEQHPASLRFIVAR